MNITPGMKLALAKHITERLFATKEAAERVMPHVHAAIQSFKHDPGPEFPPCWEIKEGKMPLEKLLWVSRFLAKVDASNTTAILESLDRIHDAIRAPRNTRPWPPPNA